jgi:hypothetical protein
MTNRQSRPRVVYRLYREDEFLQGAGGESFESVQAELVEASNLEAHDARTAELGVAARRVRRIAGTAMLLGTVGFVGGGIIKSSSRPSRTAPNRQAEHPATSAYVTATPRAALGSPSPAASGTGARRDSTASARQLPPTRRLFARIGASGARRRRYGEHGGGTDQPGAVDRRPRVTGDPTGAPPVAVQSADTEPATEAAGTHSARVGSPPLGSPANVSATAESHAVASAGVARPVTTSVASPSRQMEFGFER